MVGKSSGADTKTINLAARNQTGQLIFCQGRALYRLRLKYYPRGMNLYSSSRGMKKPVVEEMTNKEAMARVGDAKLVYRETYSIGADKKGNLVDKRYYKRKM